MFTPEIDRVLCIVLFFKSQNYLMVRSRSQYIVELSLLGRINYKTQEIWMERKIWLTGNIASMAAWESDLGLNELLECTEGEIEEDLRRWRRWRRSTLWRKLSENAKWQKCWTEVHLLSMDIRLAVSTPSSTYSGGISEYFSCRAVSTSKQE